MSEDMEALAGVLGSIEMDPYASPERHAEVLLASPWLAAHDERVRAEALAPVRAIHVRRDNPTHGCCAAPKLCNGHGPVCNAPEHGLNRPAWPCPTIAALPPERLAREAGAG